MASTNAAREPHRELARRMSHGVEVVLFWHHCTDELTVTVLDERIGTYYELAAQPHQALDVFDHPYAHAAFQGLTFQEASSGLVGDAAATSRKVVTKRCDE
jgi:hypothetical protein